ncbi:hypothetical protein [Sphingomonas sp. 10B4]|uniref:hypothetical protein n=1 Tax=Sphingomonas sp. 10B4 TaxID=3048575 RepID=UPI002AB4BFF1|nr:hypothetical protein [Sphingomonas sp. 10B4]MDY7525082.1 hypothetical protein [Sphingomonas sp. 10B4]MEB0283391.1 hypothetical protein [Sphingomonas sp. 10B4]
MAVADASSRGGERGSDAAQLGRMLFQRRKQIAGIARARQRQQMLHSVRIHHPDLARHVAFEQADRACVKELEQLLFTRPLGHGGS